MNEPTVLIVPPLGGKRGYTSSETSRSLNAALNRMTAERDEAESREISLHRLVVALLAQAFGGEVYVDATLLGDTLPTIRTEYDARTGRTRIWAEGNQ